MNSPYSALTGLLASLFLTLGFSRLAARFDELDQTTSTNISRPGEKYTAAYGCVATPCRWQEV